MFAKRIRRKLYYQLSSLICTYIYIYWIHICIHISFRYVSICESKWLFVRGKWALFRLFFFLWWNNSLRRCSTIFGIKTPQCLSHRFSYSLSYSYVMYIISKVSNLQNMRGYFFTSRYIKFWQIFDNTIQKYFLSSRADTPECLQKLHESMPLRTAAVVAAGEACAESLCTIEIRTKIRNKF